jgi:hypothetical protein
VENIRAIRENRAAVFSLKAQLARELRLSGNLDRPQKIQKNTCRAFSKPNRVRIAEGKTLPRVSALIEKLPVPERRAA